MKKSLALVLFGLCALTSAQADPAPDKPDFVPAMTRLMKVLGDKEQNLLAALANGERKTVESLLANTFQEQRGDGEVVSIPREEWIDMGLTRPDGTANSQVEVVGAREYGRLVILSLRLVGKSPLTQTRFIVDVWQDAGVEQWRLSARYSGPSAASKPTNAADGKH